MGRLLASLHQCLCVLLVGTLNNCFPLPRVCLSIGFEQPQRAQCPLTLSARNVRQRMVNHNYGRVYLHLQKFQCIGGASVAQFGQNNLGIQCVPFRMKKKVAQVRRFDVAARTIRLT